MLIVFSLGDGCIRQDATTVGFKYRPMCTDHGYPVGDLEPLSITIVNV